MVGGFPDGNGPGELFVEAESSGLLNPVSDMRVHVQRDPNVGMTEALLCDLAALPESSSGYRYHFPIPAHRVSFYLKKSGEPDEVARDEISEHGRDDSRRLISYETKRFIVSAGFMKRFYETRSVRQSRMRVAGEPCWTSRWHHPGVRFRSSWKAGRGVPTPARGSEVDDAIASVASA